MVPENPHDRMKRLSDLHDDILRLSCDVADVARGRLRDDVFYTMTKLVPPPAEVVYAEEEDEVDNDYSDLTLGHPDFQLIRACIINDVGGVRAALASGASIDEPFYSRLGVPEKRIQELVSDDCVLGILPRTTCEHPLDFAVRFGSFDALLYLLSRGANVETSTDPECYGYALALAISRRDPRTLELLVDNKCTPCSYLCMLTEESREKYVEDILWVERSLSTARYDVFKYLLSCANSILSDNDVYVHDDGHSVTESLFKSLDITEHDEY